MYTEEMIKKAFLRLNFFLLVISVGFLVSCDLNTDDPTNCDDRLAIDNAELYVTIDGSGILQFGSTPDQKEFVSCEPFPIDFQGFNGIYSVTGTLFTDCEDGTCMEVESITIPNCPVEYEINTGGQFSLFSSWKFASFLGDNEEIDPPCRSENLIFTFQRNAISDTEFPHFQSSALVANSIGFFFKISGDTIFTDFLELTDEETSPYSQIVEENISDFFIENDTILYSIEFNEMEFQSLDSSSTIRFYQE